MTSPLQKRLIILGEDNGRAFLISPTFFRPRLQPTWWKSYPFRPDICLVYDPVDQAVRALQRSIFKEVTRQHIKVVRKVIPRGCAPRVQWIFCLVKNWTESAIARIPANKKCWLVDHNGIPYQIGESLCTEAQIALGLDPQDCQVAA